MRRAKKRGRIAAGMASRGIQPAHPPGHTRNDVVSLVGEMLCAELLPCLGMGEPFHAKRREGGSSLTNGADLVLKKGGRLYAAESKHLHRSICVGTASAARTASSAINRSLAVNTDDHTAAHLGKLPEQEFRHGAACDARGDKKGRKNSDERCSFLCSVIRQKNYSLAVAIVFDDAYDPQAADIAAGLSNAGQGRLSKPVLAFAVGTGRLYDTTEDMIKRFAP